MKARPHLLAWVDRDVGARLVSAAAGLAGAATTGTRAHATVAAAAIADPGLSI